MTEIQYTYTDISSIISKNNNDFKLNENIEKNIKELFTILGCVESNVNKKQMTAILIAITKIKGVETEILAGRLLQMIWMNGK